MRTEFWIGFNIFILIMLALDLGVFNRGVKKITFRASLLWVGFWALLAFIFNGIIYYYFGREKALEFLTGYVIEWSLSVDNLFVFIVIFKYFKVPKELQHPVLFWGIVGALILRATFILAGVALFKTFEWIPFAFGAILVFTGIKMLITKEDDDPHLDQNILVRVCKKIIPVSDQFHGTNFFTRETGKLIATPLFLVFLVVEFTDLVFAVDSIPAVLSITQDTLIVYTSNVFAILGLRSLYFALAEMMGIFRFLKYGLSVILTFVGVKMIISHYYEIPTVFALTIVISILAISIICSLIFRKKEWNG